MRGRALKLLVLGLLGSLAQEGDWRAIEQRSYFSCPRNVFSSDKVPAMCDTTTTSTSTTSSTSSSSTSMSTTSTASSTTSQSSTSTSETRSSTTSTTMSTTMTASMTSTSVTSSSSTSSTTSSSSITRTSTTSLTSTSITTTSSSVTTSSSTSSISSTTMSSTRTTSSTTWTSTSRTMTSSTSSTVSQSTTVLSTTSVTSSSSTSATATHTTRTITTSTDTSATQTISSTTTATATVTGSSLTVTTSSTSTTSTTSTRTITATTVTTTSITTTETSTTTTSQTITRTSTTVVIQPCGNLCPLYALQGCKSLQSGEACIPEILVDPCVHYDAELQLQCPENNVALWKLPDPSGQLPRARCRVCGFGHVGRDQDLRKGYYEADIFFGQNSMESAIDEEPIVEYRVYLVDDVQRRVTGVLAVVPKRPEEETACCRVDAYRAHIFTVLPAGYRRFMVVPVSRWGQEMPAGAMSADVEDEHDGTDYDLGAFPPGNFSFLVHVAQEMKVGNGSVTLQSENHEVKIVCSALRLLEQAVVVPVTTQLEAEESYEVRFDPECLITPYNISAQLVSPIQGLRFRTENDTTDSQGPRMLHARATWPPNGAFSTARSFQFFFDEVALRGPGALALLRLDQGPTVVDDDPSFQSVLTVPGMVVVTPRRPLEPGSYELVFGPGAVQDAMGNMAHSSRGFEERDEWEHRVACMMGDCGETPPFGLGEYTIRVPFPEAASAPYAEFPMDTMLKHENLVLDLAYPVSPGASQHVVELCSNWTATDICPMKRVLRMEDMLFVGTKVILNPPMDLDPGSYNVSIESDVIANLESLRPDGRGRFVWSFTVSEVRDRSPPQLVAVEVVCESSASPPSASGDSGCGIWLPAYHISGNFPTWGFQGGDLPVALPQNPRFRFFFREAVQVEGSMDLWTDMSWQQVMAEVGNETEDCVVTMAPELLPGHLYTLELGERVMDMATWPEANRFEGVALKFFTELEPPEVSLASNQGLQEADRTSVIKLRFEGPARLANASSELQAEIIQVNPEVADPDLQHLRVSDPNSVIFFEHEVLFLPRPLLAGTSYRFTLPLGSVLHFDQPFSFLFTTRSEDLVPPSIVWTWPMGTLSKLHIDRMLVQVYFSEAVHPTPGKHVILRDDLGVSLDLPVDSPCLRDQDAGCLLLDLEGRRLSLLPRGRAGGVMIPWAEPGRTYIVDIEEDAFSDAITGDRMNFLAASSFSFSVHPDNEGPVLASSQPANNSGHVEQVLDSLLLVFDEEVEALQSDFSVWGTSLTRPEEAPELDMAPGEVPVNPEVGYVILTFNVDVQAGSGFFHILLRSDPVVRGNVTEFDMDVVKEVPVEEAFFVKNYVMFNPFPFPLSLTIPFFVGANSSAVMANGVTLAQDLDTSQVNVQFLISPTRLQLVYTTWSQWMCNNKLVDIELYMNEQILGLNTSDKAISFLEASRRLWSLMADETRTDGEVLQVTLDPAMPFKATIHLSQLPSHLLGSSSMPLSPLGGLYHLEVEAGLFLDRPERREENVSVAMFYATCDNFNFTCGPGRKLVENATRYRCAVREFCTEEDNTTCCEDLPVPPNATNETDCEGSNCSNETEEGGRRLAIEFRTETIYFGEVWASPDFVVPFRACEIRYQDLQGRSGRIYVPLEVERSLSGRLRPRGFEVYIPSMSVQDVLGNAQSESAMITFTHDLQMPLLDTMKCHPLNSHNATEQESIQLSFTEEVKAGRGFFELWDVEDASGPKVRVDVELLAEENPLFFGRKLIDGHVVTLDFGCPGGCELESGVTYFLSTSNPGVLYDMMDNPLPMLDTNASGTWRFYVNENVTRAPEILRVNHALNFTDMAVEVHGYLYFTQRVFQNGSFPETLRQNGELEIRDCGLNFECSTSEVVPDVKIMVEPWGSATMSLEPGLVHFLFDADTQSRRFQVTVQARAFMGADTRKGSLAGPLQPYTFTLDTGPDPNVPPDRPFVLPGGLSPVGGPMPADTNVTMFFSQEVMTGSGNISFCILIHEGCILGRFADGTPASLDVHDAFIERRKVTWPLQEFAFGQTLYIDMPEGLFVSADGMLTDRSHGEYSFTIQEGDVIAPRVLAVERRDSRVHLIVSEAVLFEGDLGHQGAVALASSQGISHYDALVDGATITIHGPFRPGETYELRHAALVDLSGNVLEPVPPSMANFSISEDMYGPAVHLPSQRLQMHEVLYIRFDEAAYPGVGMSQLMSIPPVSCGLACGRTELLANLPASLHHFEEGGRLQSMMQVDPGRALLPGVEYKLTVQAGFVQDAVGNGCDFSEATYRVELLKDQSAPQLLLSTMDGHGGPVVLEDVDHVLELFFSEVLQPLHTDDMERIILRLQPSDGGDRCSFESNSCFGENCSFPCGYVPAQQSLSIAGKHVQMRGATAVVAMPPMEYGRGYRLELELTAFQDLAQNVAESQAPQLVFLVASSQAKSQRSLELWASYPADGQTMVPMTTSLQLNFNILVQAGPGFFLLVPPEAQETQLELNRSCDDCNMSNGSNSTQEASISGSTDQEDMNHTEMEDMSNASAIRVPARSCLVWHTTVTCTLPMLPQMEQYRIHWTNRALQDEEGQWLPFGPQHPPLFRVIDMPTSLPRITSLTPAMRQPRRLSERYALAPKPVWYFAKGAVLALTFSAPMKLGTGRLRLMDCSPGDSLRCFDDRMELVPDVEVMSIEVVNSSQLILDGMNVLLVSQSLVPGRLHALRIPKLGAFVDEVGNPLLPVTSGFEFWVRADDERPPELFFQAPRHASTNGNVTLFFSEALQADLTGLINISDGMQEEIIQLSTSRTRGEGYAILRDSVVIINPSRDFSNSQDVMVSIDNGVFKDRAGNPFPGLSGRDYVFQTAPAQFRQMAANLPFPNFRMPRFIPREGAMLHWVNGSLILYGGMTASQVCLADTWVSRTGEHWTQVLGVASQDHQRILPLVAHSPTAVDQQGCIWVLGGECNNDPGTLWKTCDIGRSWFHLPRPTPVPFRGQVPPKFPNHFRQHAMAIFGGWQLVVVDASPGSSQGVWRFNSAHADFVEQVAQVPFGARYEPKLLASSQGLYLVGGHLCTDDSNEPCSFNDVWFSPDVGESWRCETKNLLAKDPSMAMWPGLGRGFASAITQDDTIFVMAGALPGEEASALVYESFAGMQDVYLSKEQPHFIMPGSVHLNQPPVPPGERFILLFGEEVRALQGAVAYFLEQPGNYSDGNDTGTTIEASVTANGKDLHLEPRQLLLPGRRYLVEMPPGHVEDVAGNPFGMIFGDHLEVEVLSDFEAPHFVSMLPTDGSQGVEPWVRLALTMSEDVYAGRGRLQVLPLMGYGARLELPVEEAVIILNKVIFTLPPGARYTPDMDYVVYMPHGLLRDRFGNEAPAASCGSFKTLSGLTTTSNYSGGGIPELPELPEPTDEEGFPPLLASWPYDGATDVPARPGAVAFFYFADEVQWTRDGMVRFYNTTHLMASIPTSEHDFLRNQSRLRVLPHQRAVQVSFPSSAVLRPGMRFVVSLSQGALQDMDLQNRSDEISITFTCLENTLGSAGPKMLAADVGPVGVPGSKHIFRFWYDKDIVKTVDQKPPVQLELPTGDTLEVPGESQNVSISQNVLTVTFAEHVMGIGGRVRLRVPRFIFTDVLARRGPLIEGGGQPTALQEELAFSVRPEDVERPQLNTTHCYPPLEESPRFEFPSNGRMVLSFSEEVKSGPGHVTFLHRSYGTPSVKIPGSAAITAGNYAILDLHILAGEVYDVTVDADAFLDLDGYSMDSADSSYVFSTMPHLRFRQLGDEHWHDAAMDVPGGRLTPSLTVDNANRIFLLGGRTGSNSSLQGAVLNDVWRLDTHKEVNCASAYEGETPCSRTRCEEDDGVFNLGTQSFRRLVWRRRSVLGGDCIAESGDRRSELWASVGHKTLRCPCPTCTSHPGPPDGPPLPLDMVNDFYVQDYTLVPSDDTRPLLCAPGMTPTGNFSCKLFDRYFAVFETPYPSCQNSSCEEPPDMAELEHFAAWDASRSTDGRYCPNISASDALRHGGLCAAMCQAGWKVDDFFRCEQGQFQAPKCWRQMCPIPLELGNGDTGRLECGEAGPEFGVTCHLLCDPGYKPSSLQTTCQTEESAAPEVAPTFQPPVNCTPNACGEYEYVGDGPTGPYGASIRYTSSNLEIMATAILTCAPGHFPAGSALGLPNPVELRCGPVIQQENEPEVEWKLTYTGARAGRICAPVGMAVYDSVVLLGSITLTLNLPSDMTKDALCTQHRDRFVGDLGLALVIGLSSAGQVPLDASSVVNVQVSACGGRLRRLATVPSGVSFGVKVANDDEALSLQLAVTSNDASDIFKRIFAQALYSASGITPTGIITSRMTRSILYEIGEPDGTQVSVVDPSSNETDNSTFMNETGPDEEGFLGSPAFIAVVAGSSACCCCCCLTFCWLRRRYLIEVYADGEESEEEGFSDDEVVDVLPEKDD